MVAPERPAIDREDQEADKLGSYALAQRRSYGKAPQEHAPSQVPDAHPAMSSAERSHIARMAIRQVGEDALDTADQSRTSEESVVLRDHVRPLADKLFEGSIARARAEAVKIGSNPDAVERAMRMQRAKRRKITG